MKLVEGALANVDVDPDLRDLAKDLRYVASLIEKGEVTGVALTWTGKQVQDGKEYKDGVGLTWTLVGGSMFALSGGVSQLQFEIQNEIAGAMNEEDE